MSTVMNKGDSKSRRKKSVALVTAALLTVSGGAAIAYWTVGGTGIGTAATGTTANITVKQTSTVTDLRPGGPAQTLSGNFDNGTGAPVFVGKVTASIVSVTPPITGQRGCAVGDYTLTDAAMTVNASVPAGDGVGGWSGAKIQFNNTEANQDNCKEATVNLAYTVG